MAYLQSEDADPGTPIEVDVRGKLRPAEVRSRPLYRRKETSG
jgi:aminomethyltransferase